MDAMTFDLIDVTVRPADDAAARPLLAVDKLSLRPGEWVHLIGPNGSGKSTFAKLAAGIPEAVAGGGVTEGTIRRGFAGEGPMPYVMQDPEAGIVGSTAREDLAMALEARGLDGRPAADEAERLLHETGLWVVADVPVESLSGGQKQLLAAAGCAAAGAPLLLFDEAASMLDSSSRAQLLRGVRRLHAGGAAVVWISHAPEEIAHGDRVIGLREGRIVYDGIAAAFFEPDEDGLSACERLGYEAPYAVRTALALRRHGVVLDPLPLTPEALAEAVSLW